MSSEDGGYRVSVTYDATAHDVYMAAHGLLHDIIRDPSERVIRSFAVERQVTAPPGTLAR